MDDDFRAPAWQRLLGPAPAPSQFLGCASVAARRVWDDQHLAVQALAFADVGSLLALRAVSLHSRGIATENAVWRPRVLSLTCASGLHAAGYLPSLTFATFLRLTRKYVIKYRRTAPPIDRRCRRFLMKGPGYEPVPFTVGRIEHDKYALAFEIRRAEIPWGFSVVLSTVCDLVTSSAFPEGERRDWALRMEQQCGQPGSVAATWDFLWLDDAPRQAIDSLELGKDDESIRCRLRFNARLIRKSDGKLHDVLDEIGGDHGAWASGLTHEDAPAAEFGEESYRNLLSGDRDTGWDYGNLTLDFRYIGDHHEEPVRNLPLLGLSLVRQTSGSSDDAATHYDVFPDRAPEGEDLFY